MYLGIVVSKYTGAVSFLSPTVRTAAPAPTVATRAVYAPTTGATASAPSIVTPFAREIAVSTTRQTGAMLPQYALPQPETVLTYLPEPEPESSVAPARNGDKSAFDWKTGALIAAIVALALIAMSRRNRR